MKHLHWEHICGTTAMQKYYYFFIITIYLTANGFLPGGSGTTVRHNTQITHHTQTKHSTQSYTNNKGHTTHNEHNANTITIHTTIH
jgi:hypothetical protein